MEETTKTKNASFKQDYRAKRHKVLNNEERKRNKNVRHKNRYFNSRNYGNKQEFVHKNFHHSGNKFHYSRDDRKFKVKESKRTKKLPSRPNSPDEGSEEYMNKKIQKTSAIIMRHLLSPDESIISLKTDKTELPTKPKEIIIETKNKRKRSESANESSFSESSNNVKHKKNSVYDVADIHNKIMVHLTNLNDGRKKNLISNTTSVYDDAIRHILQQKRLEISRALRSVCLKSSDVTESSEWINSIIPDMGIKIEDLPQEILEELQNTFRNVENFEDFNCSEETVTNSPNDIIEQIDCTTLENPTINLDTSIEVVEILKNDILMDANLPNRSSPNLTVDNNDISLENVDEKLHLDEIDVKEEISSMDDIKITIDENVTPTVTETTDKQTEILEPESDEQDKLVSISDNVEISEKITIEDFLQSNFKKPPKNYSQAIKRMFTIDKYIKKLTEYRQSLFTDVRDMKKPIKNLDKKKKIKKKTKPTTVKSDSKIGEAKLAEVPTESEENSKIEASNSGQVQNTDNSESLQKILEFEDIKEKVLVLKVCEDRLLAATESGKIFFYNLKTGSCENVLNVTSLPITSLAYKNDVDGKPYLFAGSCESSLKVYNLYSTCLLQSFALDDSVQCMDENWGYLFLGCLRGTIIRYSIKKQQLEYQEQFSPNPVFVLKATQEGARKVLLIGSKDSPVIVRDAMSGLHLRILKIMFPTVYSMIMHNHFVICGTKLNDILIFNFHNGNLEHTFKATLAKGVACMKVVGNCLFASCHNGKIYVFNLETKFLVDTMSGPGGVIISMEVLSNQVIVGTLSFKLGSIPISQKVLSQIY